MASTLTYGIIRFEELRSVDFNSVSGTYAGVGDSFSNPVRLLCIDNTLDQNILVSFDGITDHTFVSANGFKLLDYCSNKSVTAGLSEQPAGTRVYVKEESSAATSGNVYVTVVYAAGA